MTVDQAFKPFMTYGRTERGYAKETLIKYQDCFRVWVLPYIGNRKLTEITRLDILDIRLRRIVRQLLGVTG